MHADLALSALCKSYGSTLAVDHVTMRIKEGQLVAFLGPSGCGKTTTLRMIAGLIEPTSGDVLIGGNRVTNTPPHRRNIGMLFQSYALFPHMSVMENVAYGLRMRRMPRAVCAEKARAALALVQLAHVADRFPQALSGGQQQRVALARALVIAPSLLLLDEPLGALDKNLREVMQVELRQIQRKLGITTILVTHDQEEALTMADQIVIMNRGRIDQMGSPSEIYSRPVNRFVASFIGASNFLSGRVVARSGDGARIALKGGGEITLAGKVSDRPELEVTVRPEAVEITPDADDPRDGLDTNWTRATVEEVIYRGQATHVLMRRSGDEAFLAYVPNRGGARSLMSLNRGDQVRARWHTDANHVLAAD